jgi:dihydrodipicolinate synthase/N-acetylneuraminate lyase
LRKSNVTFDDLTASVIAVPPVARRRDLRFHREENRKLIRHLEAGGVTTLLYGGNANLYHVRVSEYAGLLALLLEAASEETVLIPSVGPAYGVMMDQARVLLDFQFPTAMVLPPLGISTPEGVETGIRHFVEALGRPAILYLRQEGALTIEGIRRLSDDGLFAGIKYAIVRDQPARDDFLRQLIEFVDPRSIVSGLGEQPAIIHMQQFQLGGFTSGCVCVAPHLSTSMLQAIRGGDLATAERIRAQFAPLEKLRNDLGPVRVLHDAICLCGIADTGPILPLLSHLSEEQRGPVEKASQRLLALDRASGSA